MANDVFFLAIVPKVIDQNQFLINIIPLLIASTCIEETSKVQNQTAIKNNHNRNKIINREEHQRLF